MRASALRAVRREAGAARRAAHSQDARARRRELDTAHAVRRAAAAHARALLGRRGPHGIRRDAVPRAPPRRPCQYHAPGWPPRGLLSRSRLPLAACSEVVEATRNRTTRPVQCVRAVLRGGAARATGRRLRLELAFGNPKRTRESPAIITCASSSACVAARRRCVGGRAAAQQVATTRPRVARPDPRGASSPRARYARHRCVRWPPRARAAA